MSSKKCSRCDKTVYPLEEIKCLDKIWHKLCFKCQECGMTLNMKTYKGYNKLPYCNAHCPQAKHTAVADTPEIRRLAENTRIQSQVKYHEDFEKQKGKVTQVADDPETVRIRNASKMISNVAYHGDIEKKKQMEQKRHLVPEKNGMQLESPEESLSLSLPEASPTSPVKLPPGKIADFDPMVPHESPYSSKLASTVIFTSEEGPVENPPSRRIGSIADYDPLNDNYGSLASGARPNPLQPQNMHFFADMQQGSNKMNNVSGMQRAPGRNYRAMYDYAASDTDEVSFLDGDIIINCVPIDEGWMTGIVQRTGQSGMLPANYVAPIN